MEGKAKVALTFALYQQGGALVRRETITQDIVKVGKDPRSHLRIDDELASRMHAVIEVGAEDITLIDLGNEPGTFVNGARVNKCKIRPGDQIQIGATTVHFEAAEPAQPGPPALDAAPTPAMFGTASALFAPPAPTPTAPVAMPSSNPFGAPPPSAAGNPFAAPPASVPTPPPPSAVPFAAPLPTPAPPAANPFAPPPSSANPFGGAAQPVPAAPPPPVSNPFASAPPAANPFGAPPSPASNPFAAGGGFAPPANPFAAAAPAAPAHRFNAPGGSDFDPNQPYTYSLVRSGPPVLESEAETPAAAVEVRVKWGDNTLHAKVSSPPKTFFVGEATPQAPVDYNIPVEVLNAQRAPICVARGVSAALVMLPQSSGWVEIPGRGRMTFEALIASGAARPSSEVSGGYEIELSSNAKAEMRLPNSSLVFEVSAVNAGRAVAGGFSGFDAAAAGFIALSAFFHVGILATMFFFMPAMGNEDAEAIDRDQLMQMQKLLNAAAERELEQKEAEQQPDQNADNKEGGTGTRAKGEEGSMGNPTTKDTNKRYGVQGPQDNPDPHLAKQAALKEAQEFGMIGLLNTGAGGDPNAPTAPWGRDDSSGTDPLSARGNMWGDAIGDAFGNGGLGLTGLGEGGGGRGEGVGLGNIGTLGHGAGTGSGQGFGGGHGRLGGAHVAKAPKLTTGATQVNGRLPPEVIQRIVRQNFGRFKLCYENGLRNNPSLSGRVAVKFVIDRSGAVSTAQDGGSELPDQGVVSCVVRGFGNLSFPQPEGGIVRVVYPITFTPGD